MSRSSVLLTVLLLTVSPVHAQQRTALIDAYMSVCAGDEQFSGAVLVADSAGVVFNKGYGEANREWHMPNSPATKFRIGSVTKQFTAMLVLQMVRKGVLDLHAPVVRYLPDFPAATGKRITLLHLLTHTSGLFNYTDIGDPGLQRRPFSPEALIRLFADSTLRFEPGTRWEYCNSGYILLGAILEKVTGKPYQQLLGENIFIPLDMKHSGVDAPEPVIEYRAAGYEQGPGGFINARFIDPSFAYSAGSVYSTTEDLYRWDRALYGEQLLPHALLDTLFGPRIRVEGGPPGGSLSYAFGWFTGYDRVGSTNDSTFVIKHGGRINGFTSLVVRMPATHGLIVLLHNGGGANLEEIARAIRGILTGRDYALPRRSAARALRKAIAGSTKTEIAQIFGHMKDSTTTYYVSENEMNGLGYALLGEKKLEQAIAVFRATADAFPGSSNAYDSLGEAYAAHGDTGLAIQSYEKSVALNPANQNGRDALKRLGNR